jgi:hypothetical protein
VVDGERVTDRLELASRVFGTRETDWWIDETRSINTH